MKVELRGVKHFPSMTEETECFQATLVLDGQVRGTVENTGKGGCHRYSDRSLYDVKDFDHLVDDALMDELHKKDLKRLLKGKLLFVRDGRILSVKGQTLSTWTGRKEGDVFLNELPMDEALKLYKEFGK